MNKISMKFAMKFEIQKGLKYEICMKFNRNLKFATEIWNIDVILLSDWSLTRKLESSMSSPVATSLEVLMPLHQPATFPFPSVSLANTSW